MVFHDERRTTGVRRVVSRTSHNEMPSTPSAYRMPHCGIHERDSTSWNPAIPSWNCCRIVSENTKVASEVKRPIALIALTAPLGRKERITATAIGNQMIQLSTLVMAPHPALRATLSPLRGARDRDVPLPLAGEGAAKRRVRASREYPYEDDHSQEEPERVVAHVAGLEKSQQIADPLDDVADEREQPVDQVVDAAPQELRGALERCHHSLAVELVDVILVLERGGQSGCRALHRLIARELRKLIARLRQPPA